MEDLAVSRTITFLTEGGRVGFQTKYQVGAESVSMLGKRCKARHVGEGLFHLKWNIQIEAK